ncbi:hypothetical protein M9H77_02813 [Catharanthus roseus]|uniref:Uncharacterized protein n=1 Tax=Catharanthus roseus TaxID=4058 RepID=A0ACC0C9M2_CATRO|nr:hypothetical protein M9H77_02813 [Catharanthus roseus]
MGYTWGNSSWQRMEAIGRQKMAYSKLARARFNCYKNEDFGGNAYRGSHHRDGHFTHRSQMGIGNCSSRAKTFDHIPYDDCCENSPYDVHKGYHGSHDNSDQNCGREVNHEGLIGENHYLKLFLDGYGYEFLEFNLTCSTFYSRYFSHSCYEVVKFLFYDVIGQRDHSSFINVHHQVINLDRTYLLVVQDLSHAILVFIAHDAEPWNICDFLRDANHCTFCFLEKNSYGFDGSLLSLLGVHCVKLQEEFWEKSWSMFLKFRFDGTLFYHPLFKEFLKKMRFKEGGRGSWSFDHFVSTSTHLNFQVLALVKYKVYPSCPNALEFPWKVIFAYYHILGRDAFQTFSFLALFLELKMMEVSTFTYFLKML